MVASSFRISGTVIVKSAMIPKKFKCVESSMNISSSLSVMTVTDNSRYSTVPTYLKKETIPSQHILYYV
jgi:hypothetical protein